MTDSKMSPSMHGNSYNSPSSATSRQPTQPHPRSPRKKTRLISALKGAAIGLVAGVILGVGGLTFVQNYNPPDNQSQTATTVFERIVSQNELVSVSQDYCIVDKVTDSNSFFNLFDIPLTENSFWYRYAGTLKAGVNLEDASLETPGNNVLIITLNEPYIISNTPDMETSGVLEERNNILNPIHVEDVDAFQAQCVQKSQEEALSSGLLDEAKTSAETNIRNLFYAALGDSYTVEFNWQTAEQSVQ